MTPIGIWRFLDDQTNSFSIMKSSQPCSSLTLDYQCCWHLFTRFPQQSSTFILWSLFVIVLSNALAFSRKTGLWNIQHRRLGCMPGPIKIVLKQVEEILAEILRRFFDVRPSDFSIYFVWFCFTSNHHILCSPFKVRRHGIGCINHDIVIGLGYERLMRL